VEKGSLPSKDPAHRRGSDHFLPSDSKEKNPYHTLLVGQTLLDFSTLARKGARIEASVKAGAMQDILGQSSSTGTLAASTSTVKTSANRRTGEAKKSEGEVHLILPAPTQQVQAIGRSPLLRTLCGFPPS